MDAPNVEVISNLMTMGFDPDSIEQADRLGLCGDMETALNFLATQRPAAATAAPAKHSHHRTAPQGPQPVPNLKLHANAHQMIPPPMKGIRPPPDLSTAKKPELASALWSMGYEDVGAIHQALLRHSTIEGAIDFLSNSLNATVDIPAVVPSAPPAASVYPEQGLPYPEYVPAAAYYRTPPRPPPPRELDNSRNPALARELWSDFGYQDVAAINEALLRSNDIAGALRYLTPDKEAATNPAMADCPLSLEKMKVEDMYIMGCKHEHKFDPAYLLQHIRISLLGGDDAMPHIPACPSSSMGDDPCRYMIDYDELHTLIAHQAAEAGISASDIATMSRAVDRLYSEKGHRERREIRCIGCMGDNDEGVWFATSPGRFGFAIDHIECPTCTTSFCTKCNVSPHHFNCSCEQVVAYTRAWNDWNSNGKVAFMRELASQSEQYQRMMADYNAQKQRHEAEAAAAAARFAELKADEELKARTCKRCPHCQRVVEKLEGCDLMVCGQNYHGGDVQNGCGQGFRWTQAPAYEANTGERRAVDDLKAPQPKEIETLRHMICEGYPMPCDVCGEGIVGARIMCLNCPGGFNMCLQCSNDSPEIHNHRRNHICRVIMRDGPTDP